MHVLSKCVDVGSTRPSTLRVVKQRPHHKGNIRGAHAFAQTGECIDLIGKHGQREFDAAGVQLGKKRNVDRFVGNVLAVESEHASTLTYAAMKILYGVTGEGMGHAIRSGVILEHLIGAESHEVEILASNRAATYLSQRFGEVHTIHGLHIVTEDNRVKKGKTLWSNVREGLKNLPGQVDSYFGLIEDFRPEAVISDFESFAYLYAKAHDLPIFSIDNQQLMSRCIVPDEVIGEHRADFEIVKGFVKAKLPFCDHYLIATFFDAPIRKKRTSLFGPILRPQVLDAKVTRGDHLLVYQTTQENTALVDALKASGLECRVYGMRRDLDGDVTDDNLVHRPFSETTFIEDLASARAVIASAGFTLMGECVVLHKPLLAVPLEGQFEQVLNARYLEHLGYGAMAERVDTDSLQAFLAQCPEYERALEPYAHDRNEGLLNELDALLDQAAAGLF